MLNQAMRLIILLLLGLQACPAVAANSCLVLFLAHRQNTIEATYDKAYASQEVLGTDYAWIKALTDAGLDISLKLGELTPKQSKTLVESLLEEIKTKLPVVIAPDGKMFILDGHHDLYLAHLLNIKASDIPIEFSVVKDYSTTGISMAEFKAEAQAHGWFYGSVDKIVDNAKKPNQLIDSPARSQVGLAFLLMREHYDIPMKGKHFSPFVQFYLIELMTQNKLFVFEKDYSNAKISELVALMLSNKLVLQRLVNDLKPNAPKKLREFLEEMLANLS